MANSCRDSNGSKLSRRRDRAFLGRSEVCQRCKVLRAAEPKCHHLIAVDPVVFVERWVSKRSHASVGLRAVRVANQRFAGRVPGVPRCEIFILIAKLSPINLTRAVSPVQAVSL